MSKVQPANRRRHCVCGRPCGDLATTWSSSMESTSFSASNGISANTTSNLQPEKPLPTHTTPPAAPVAPIDSLTLLQLKVRALEKYKTNYELLCSQLAELNTQVGLQLQRHEVDVTTLQATIAALQTTNAALQHELRETNQELLNLKNTSEKDRDYSNGVHKQLTTVAELLKSTEKRLKDHECESQNEIKRHKATQDEYTKLRHAHESLLVEMTSLRDQIVKQGDGDKLRKKYRTEIKNLRQESEQLREELEQQRAATRQVKKHFRSMREDRDALVKQLGIVKSDSTHLTEIIESQREEVRRQEKKTQQWKRAHQEINSQLSETHKNLEDSQMQLASIQETLVNKNVKVEELLLESHELKKRLDGKHTETVANHQQIELLQNQLQHLQKQYDTQKKEIEVVIHQDEQEGKEMQRKYRKELQRMKQLLSLNHQRTSESFHDMHVLKQELSGVQELLRRCHKQQRRCTNANNQKSDDDETDWRLRHQRAEVEKAVLQSAIMDQVERACASSEVRREE